MDNFEIIRELLRRDRSVRRFDENRSVGRETLERLVELTRYCASGRNLQPLRYRIVNDVEECAAIFPHLAWAGYLKEWAGPIPGERPVSYLIQCLDTRITANCLCDDGLQLQAITLGATALGIGCCIIKSFNVEKVAGALGIPANCKPLYVLAMGYPAETIVLEDMPAQSDADFKYYRTSDEIHHVPKRQLQQLIID